MSISAESAASLYKPELKRPLKSPNILNIHTGLLIPQDQPSGYLGQFGT
jgi:hypothetical protein